MHGSPNFCTSQSCLRLPCLRLSLGFSFLSIPLKQSLFILQIASLSAISLWLNELTQPIKYSPHNPSFYSEDNSIWIIIIIMQIKQNSVFLTFGLWFLFVTSSLFPHRLFISSPLIFFICTVSQRIFVSSWFITITVFYNYWLRGERECCRNVTGRTCSLWRQSRLLLNWTWQVVIYSSELQALP